MRRSKSKLTVWFPAPPMKCASSIRCGSAGRARRIFPSYITVDGERLAFLGCVEGDEWVYRYALPAGKVNAEGRVTLEAQKDVGPRGTGFTEVWMLLR